MIGCCACSVSRWSTGILSQPSMQKRSYTCVKRKLFVIGEIRLVFPYFVLFYICYKIYGSWFGVLHQILDACSWEVRKVFKNIDLLLIVVSSNSYAFFVLSKLPACSRNSMEHAKPFLNFNIISAFLVSSSVHQ